MKAFLHYLITLVSCFYAVFMLQGCGPINSGIWQNESIAKEQQPVLHHLNDQLYAAFKANNRHDIENLMSKELIDTPGNARQIELMSNQSQLGKYEMFDEFYIVNQFDEGDQKIKIVSSGKHSYSLNLRGLTRQMYVAMLIPKTTGEKSMITLVYCKYSYGWKLTKYELGPFTINGKTAPQLLEQSKQMQTKGYLVDAFNTIDLANKCSQPNDMWLYPQQDEITKLYETLSKQANDAYTFPMVIADVPTKPAIFNIVNQTLDNHVYPDVYYVSHINIKDTVALHKESAQVKQAIGKLLPGINKDKKYILFSVFNEKPTAKKNTPSFDITEKL